MAEVVEVRRYCIRSSEDLTPYLKDVQYSALGGGEYRIFPDDYGRALAHLANVGGMEIHSAREQRRELGYIDYRPARRGLIPFDVETPERWTYLSHIARRWRRCNQNHQGQLLVRPGWALAEHSERGRPKYYYCPPDHFGTFGKDLTPFRVARGDVAIRQSYSGVLGVQPVPFWATDTLLFALWPGYVIPKEHERFLSRTLLAVENPLANDEGETIWVWSASDRPWVEDTLRGLRLRLVGWEAEQDWVYTASLVLRRSYGQYLHRRGGGEELRLLLRQRAWHAIEDETLREMLHQLMTAEANGDAAATALLRFSESHLCEQMDYREEKAPLDGWVIESSPVVYQDKVLDKRYYRVVLPEKELVVGWETRRQPDWEGDAQPRVRIHQWHIAPYVGRMKTMPRAPAPEPGLASRDLRDSSYRTLLGIATIEAQLARDLSVGVFMVDLDGAHWRGCNDLSRYFSGYGKIERRNPDECEGYGLLLTDPLGNRFVLETSILSPQEIPEFGEWVHFIARSSLLGHQSRERINQQMPVFDLAVSRNFRRAYPQEVLNNSLLAFIRYHWGISSEDVVHTFSGQWSKAQVVDQIASLAGTALVKDRDKLYYRYPRLTLEEMGRVVNAEGDSYWRQVRQLLHPLYVRTVRIREAEAFEVQHRLYQLNVSRARADNDLLDEIDRHLKQSGAVKLSAIGGQIIRAQKLIERLVSESTSLRVSRNDGHHQFLDGERKTKIEYLIVDQLRQMQAKYRR